MIGSTIYDEYIEEQDILNVLTATFDLKIYPFTPSGSKRWYIWLWIW